MSEEKCKRCEKNVPEVLIKIQSKNDASFSVDYKMCRSCAEEVKSSTNSSFQKQAVIYPL